MSKNLQCRIAIVAERLILAGPFANQHVPTMSETDQETRSAPLDLRLTPHLQAALDRAATANRQTLAAYVENVLSEHLRRTGYLAPLHRDEGLRPDQLTTENDG